MKLRTLSAALAASFAFAGAALADGQVSATLQNPAPSRTTVIAGGGLFVCAANVCVADGAPSRAFTVSGCKELVRAVGPVAAFGSGAKALDPDSLARCNANARTAAR
jgi:hypothetical protein